MRKQYLLLVCAGLVFLTAAVVALYRARDRFAPGPVPSARVTPEDENISEDDGPDPAHGIDIDEAANRVTRKDVAGTTLWSTPLDGRLGGVRHPHVQADVGRAYVTHADGVTALDVRTGAVLWHSPGPANGLLVSGALLFATGRGGEKAADSERWVMARDVASGKEVFRDALPANFDALAVAEKAALILVQDWDKPGGEGFALLMDRTGRVVHRFDRQVAAAHLLAGGDRLILTSRDVVRLSDAGDVTWSAPFKLPGGTAGGGFVPSRMGM